MTTTTVENYEKCLLDTKKSYAKGRCGCMNNIEQIKNIIKQFPGPNVPYKYGGVPRPRCCSTEQYGTAHENTCKPPPPPAPMAHLYEAESFYKDKQRENRLWTLLYRLAYLLQMFVLTMASLFYYLILIYMHIIHTTLKSGIYFHNADTPMRITIAIVIVTAMVVLVNLIAKLERLLHI